MAKSKELKRVSCDTVGDLLDALAEIAKDPEIWDVLSASLETCENIVTGFKITEDTLSDKSKVFNFEFIEE